MHYFTVSHAWSQVIVLKIILPFLALVLLLLLTSGNMYPRLMHAFVTSVLDDCVFLFVGCAKVTLNSLQLSQHAAARVLMRLNTRNHVPTNLVSIHWLPVKYRIEFKFLLLTYKAQKGLAPSCLKEFVI